MSGQFKDMTAANDARVDFARSALVQRMAALERRVTNTVDKAADSVNEVTDTVKSTMHSATDSVHQIRQFVTADMFKAIDLRATMRKAPWTTIGIAVAGGLIAAAVIAKKGWIKKGANALSSVGDRIAETGPGFGDLIKRELTTLGQSVIHDVSGMVKEQLHGLAERQVERFQHRTAAHDNEPRYAASH